MKNKFNFAFEVSDNFAQYGHMLPLLHECMKDPSITVSLYSNNIFNIKKLESQYMLLYKDKNIISLQINILNDNVLNRLKKSALKTISFLGLKKVIPLIRTLFVKFKSSNTTEDYSNFYKNNSTYFLKQDLILTTELKGGDWIYNSPIKLTWLLHGIISNENPFFKNWKCHYVISPQVELERKLKERNLLPRNVIFYKNAYLKKDIIELKSTIAPLFLNSNPTIVYNPHWDNALNQSSWFKYGLEILNFFKENKNFNLVFAPHILLNKFYKIDIPEQFFNEDNIIIDIKSDNLTDGSYIKCADYYIGDVSSQFFEFCLCNERVKPIFINTAKMDWKNNSTYSYWNKGVVIENIDELPFAIKKLSNIQIDYSDIFYSIPKNQSKLLLEFLKNQL